MKNFADKVASYDYLWEDDPERYVLIQTDRAGDGLETCLIYDLSTKTALLEEDDDVYREIKSRLAKRGAPIVFDIP